MTAAKKAAGPSRVSAAASAREAAKRERAAATVDEKRVLQIVEAAVERAFRRHLQAESEPSISEPPVYLGDQDAEAPAVHVLSDRLIGQLELLHAAIGVLESRLAPVLGDNIGSGMAEMVAAGVAPGTSHIARRLAETIEAVQQAHDRIRYIAGRLEV